MYRHVEFVKQGTHRLIRCITSWGQEYELLTFEDRVAFRQFCEQGLEWDEQVAGEEEKPQLPECVKRFLQETEPNEE